jgi:hypothetical protein
MGKIMKLIDVILEIDSLNGESTIYAAMPWTESSQAIVAKDPDKGGLPVEVDHLGLKYFIEVSIARDFLDGWIANLEKKPTPPQQCARLIKYAITDA